MNKEAKSVVYWAILKPDGTLRSPYHLQMPALYPTIGKARRHENEGEIVQVTLNITPVMEPVAKRRRQSPIK